MTVGSTLVVSTVGALALVGLGAWTPFFLSASLIGVDLVAGPLAFEAEGASAGAGLDLYDAPMSLRTAAGVALLGW